jgi:CxxC-x17-CxxC domain-containing protein
VAFQERELQCADCGENFAFTVGEQEFYAAKGYTNDPKRCQACRQKRKAERGDGGNRRQMFSVVCAQCGQDTEVPFEPRQGKPVYCSACFSRTRGDR